MKKINWLLSLIAVALCGMYGCENNNTYCVSGCDNDGSVSGLKNGNCDTSSDCGKDQICENHFCKNKTESKPNASCSDTKKNGDETDVDCGGSCDKCANKKHCSKNSDCLSDNCDNGICKAVVALCADGIRSGDESDVDCGGSSCELCADGKTCNADDDCASNMCDGVCISCTDGISNGTESDVDCGGSCGKCADGKTCNSKDDCASGFCDGNVCTSCSDGAQNGDESDVDCGGRCGATCVVDKKCHSDNDCESYNCIDNICKGIDCSEKADAGDIIINEVFANPDTSANLEHSNNKQMKYIELYNKSDRTLQLYNLSLTYNGNEIHAKGCIPAKTYLIIHPSGQTLTALDLDAKTLASDNIESAVDATSGNVRLVKRADSTVIHSATVPETEKGTAAGRSASEDSSMNDEAMVPHTSVKTIESGVKNLYSPGLPNSAGFPMG
ncbi:MAG: lamin tail domain-containing protein [Proteobacteria bacterium]|nr:lamin tail domain-containing protein [Pseudomonadota bacterium]